MEFHAEVDGIDRAFEQQEISVTGRLNQFALVAGAGLGNKMRTAYDKLECAQLVMVHHAAVPGKVSKHDGAVRDFGIRD
jgi:hypothetical protein